MKTRYLPSGLTTTLVTAFDATGIAPTYVMVFTFTTETWLSYSLVPKKSVPSIENVTSSVLGFGPVRGVSTAAMSAPDEWDSSVATSKNEMRSVSPTASIVPSGETASPKGYWMVGLMEKS